MARKVGTGENSKEITFGDKDVVLARANKIVVATNFNWKTCC